MPKQSKRTGPAMCLDDSHYMPLGNLNEIIGDILFLGKSEQTVEELDYTVEHAFRGTITKSKGEK